MRMTIDSTCEPKPMSKEEIVDTLKTMVFGRQAFERFNAKERETLDKAWNIIDQYEARLKADMVAMLEDLISEANELEDPKYILETSELPLDVDGTTLPLETYALQCYCRGGEEVIDIIEKKIDALKEVVEDD